MPTPRQAKRTPTLATLTDEIDARDLGVERLPYELAPDPDILALQIDRNLNERIWHGTSFTDRTLHMTSKTAAGVLDQIERSLFARERYDDYEARMLRHLGVTEVEAEAGVIGALERQLTAELRMAWNEGIIDAHENEADIELVWSCALKDTSTPGCIWRHGRTITELDGEVPLHHFGCLCQMTPIPSPNSQNATRAAEGRAILDRMAEEREASGGGDPLGEANRAPRLSRLFREAELDEMKEPQDVVPISEAAGGTSRIFRFSEALVAVSA